MPLGQITNRKASPPPFLPGQSPKLPEEKPKLPPPQPKVKKSLIILIILLIIGIIIYRIWLS